MSVNVKDSKNWSFETKQLHVGQELPDSATDARAVPIYASSSFVFRNSQHAADRFGLRDAATYTADLQTRQTMFLKKE